jgi:hypothetical protein
MTLQGVSWAWQAQSTDYQPRSCLMSCYNRISKPVGAALADDRENSKRGLSPIVPPQKPVWVLVCSLFIAEPCRHEGQGGAWGLTVQRLQMSN